MYLRLKKSTVGAISYRSRKFKKYMKINNINSNITFDRKNINNNNKAKTSTKIAALAGSTIGVTAAVAMISCSHGVKILSILKNPNALLNILKNIELKEKDVIAIASSSIAGGLAGGLATDRKNAKAKLKEGVVQLIGNYVVPTIAVGGGIKLNKALNKKYNVPPITRPIQFLFGMASLIVGVIAGNKISRTLNAGMFKEDDYRKLNWKDWAVQFDNVCLVTSISNTGTQLAKMASRFIPFAHIAPGYQVGVKQTDLNINA